MPGKRARAVREGGRRKRANLAPRRRPTFAGVLTLGDLVVRTAYLGTPRPWWTVQIIRIVRVTASAVRLLSLRSPQPRPRCPPTRPGLSISGQPAARPLLGPTADHG